MAVKFDIIHHSVVEALKLKDRKSPIFKTIGRWYYLFLISSEEKLSLKLPYFDQRFTNSIYEYLRVFFIFYKLSNKPRPESYKECCLFDLFKYQNSFNKRDTESFIIPFLKEKQNSLLWEKNTAIQRNIFTPIFKRKQLASANLDVVNKTFELFKVVRIHDFIKHPILVDLESDICLTICTGDYVTPQDYILLESIVYEKGNEDDSIELEDKLIEKNINDQISFKYPYNRNIRSWLLDIGKKRFELNLYNRFSYQTLSDNDIFLLPSEKYEENNIWEGISFKMDIINTNHSQELYDLLAELKADWQGYEFNKFTTPFPKYWFMFINDSQYPIFWITDFKNSYPQIAETPLMKNVEKLIYQLHKANWGQYLAQNSKEMFFYFPSITGIRSKILQKAFSSFKNYMQTLNPRIEFIDESCYYNYRKYDHLIILNGFDVIDVVNIFQNNPSINCKIVLPDFLYFVCQPWSKYYFINYIGEALLSSKRKKLDPDFDSNLSQFAASRESIISKTRHELKDYLGKYKKDGVVIHPSELEKEELQFANDEEIEIIKRKVAKEYQYVNITTSGDLEIKVPSNSEVLIQRNNIISCQAIDLQKGDLFIPMYKINALEYDEIIDKLSKVPESVRYFQIKLSLEDKVYVTLESRGLHYSSEEYFNSKYLIQKSDFDDDKLIIPKRKKHWEIICQFLNISNNDMIQGWISYYGRKQINELKAIYRGVLNLLINENFVGQVGNPLFVSKVIELINNKRDVFEDMEEFNPEEISRSIISSILGVLEFQEVKEFKIDD